VTPPSRVCVVMLSAIGDATHVLPVLTAIKRAWPQTHLTWIVQPTPSLVGLHHPALDDVIHFHRGRGIAGLSSFAEIAHAVKDRRYDLVIDLQVYFKAGVITGLINAPRKLGFDRERARDVNWLFTTERIPAHPSQHVQDQYFEFLTHLEIDPFPVDWQLVISDAEREAQREFFAAVERPACAVVLSASRKKRSWRVESYATMIDYLADTHGLQPILVGGPSDAERDAAEAVKRLARAEILDTLGDDLRRLIWLVDGAALTVAPDTGPLHISRAVETPVVGMYGQTNPKRAGPYRLFTDLVVDGYAEFPGEAYAPSMEYRDGMKRVTVEMVCEKIDLAMEKYVRGP
jgi:heptosyltransferase I